MSAGHADGATLGTNEVDGRGWSSSVAGTLREMPRLEVAQPTADAIDAWRADAARYQASPRGGAPSVGAWGPARSEARAVDPR